MRFFPLILCLTFSKEELCLDHSVEIVEILGSSCVLGLSHEISEGMGEVEIDIQSANSELGSMQQQPQPTNLQRATHQLPPTPPPPQLP